MYKRLYAIFVTLLWPIIIGLLPGCGKNRIDVAVKQVNVSTTNNLYDIVFVDTLHGYIVGGSRYASSDLLVTSDGGHNWSLTQIPPDGNKAVYGIAAHAGRVMAVGYDGKIFTYHADDREWSYVQSAWWEWFQGIAFAREDKAFVVAGVGYQNGRIMEIDTLGTVLRADSFDFELSDICFTNALTGYACGYGAILKTGDGGQSWRQLDIKGDFYKALFCTVDGQIWCVGYNGSMVHSSDDGENWEKERTGGNLIKQQWRLRDIAFKNGKEGMAVGDKGLIVRTVDGGTSWQQISSPVQEDLHAVTYQPGGQVWVVGAAGTVLRISP